MNSYTQRQIICHFILKYHFFPKKRAELLLSLTVMANKAYSGGIKPYSEPVGITFFVEIDKRIMIGIN